MTLNQSEGVTDHMCLMPALEGYKRQKKGFLYSLGGVDSLATLKIRLRSGIHSPAKLMREAV